MKKIVLKYFVFILCCLTPVSALSQTQNPNSVTAIKADDLKYHVSLLASDVLKGRLAGSDGGRLAAAYIANEFERYGLIPGGDTGTYFQAFEFTSGVSLGEENMLSVTRNDNRESFNVERDYIPLGFSSNASVSGEVVFAGYGITAEKLSYNDYEEIDADGKIVVAFMYAPEQEGPQGAFVEFEAVRYKAMNARRHGASALLLCYGYESGEVDELPKLRFDQVAGDTGIPVAHISRNLLEKIFAGSDKNVKEIESGINTMKKPLSFQLDNVTVSLSTDLMFDKSLTQNVVGYLKGSSEAFGENAIVIGAHYDHLGLGSQSSMAPSQIGNVHYGADDNASGVAGLLELAQKFSAPANLPNRKTIFIAFGAEEWGILGSTYYTKNPVTPLEKTDFMVNFDMIGRLTNNVLTVNGTGSSSLWEDYLNEVNGGYNFELKFSPGGFGGSDHTPFYSRKIPVLFFFTGTHQDYHKPSDTIDKLDLEGEVKILLYAEEMLRKADLLEEVPFTEAEQPQQQRPARSFRVTLGVVPDFTRTDVEGMPISDVVAGGPAEKGGLKGGDIIQKLGGKDIKNIYDYMYILGELKPGDDAEAVVLRGEEVITFQLKMQRKK